ncbi:hypothetical protein BH24DEI2_BH24DEI2_04730 [soil metagenome]
MRVIALEWLPVVLSLGAFLTGFVGLGSALFFKNRRSQLIGSALYLVAGTLLVLPVVGFVREQVATVGVPRVEIGVTTDPDGANVYLDDVFVGTTPLTFERLRGTRVRYRVEAKPSVLQGAAFESYEDDLVVKEAVTVSVWLNRLPLEP